MKAGENGWVVGGLESAFLCMLQVVQANADDLARPLQRRQHFDVRSVECVPFEQASPGGLKHLVTLLDQGFQGSGVRVFIRQIPAQLPVCIHNAQALLAARLENLKSHASFLSFSADLRSDHTSFTRYP
ncbi:hypothetical protein D3C81_1233510 [compost metagenome]